MTIELMVRLTAAFGNALDNWLGDLSYSRLRNTKHQLFTAGTRHNGRHCRKVLQVEHRKLAASKRQAAGWPARLRRRRRRRVTTRPRLGDLAHGSTRVAATAQLTGGLSKYNAVNAVAKNLEHDGKDRVGAQTTQCTGCVATNGNASCNPV